MLAVDLGLLFGLPSAALPPPQNGRVFSVPHAAALRPQNIAPLFEAVIHSRWSNVIMRDVGRVQRMQPFHQIRSQRLEFPDCPIPHIFALVRNYLVKCGVHPLHYQSVGVRLTQQIDARADNEVISDAMQEFAVESCDNFREKDFAEDAGERVAGLVGVGPDY